MDRTDKNRDTDRLPMTADSKKPPSGDSTATKVANIGYVSSV